MSRRKAVGARLGERRQLILRPPRAALAKRAIVVGGAVDQLLARRPVADQRSRHADRAAGVEHVEHRPCIGRRDAQRGVRAAGRRAADQQRQRHPGALHLLGDGDHLVERRA